MDVEGLTHTVSGSDTSSDMEESVESTGTSSAGSNNASPDRYASRLETSSSNGSDGKQPALNQKEQGVEGDAMSREQVPSQRVLANRRSARESKRRRKQLIQDLQESIDRMATDNEELLRSNNSIRREVCETLRSVGISIDLPELPMSEAAMRSRSESQSKPKSPSNR